MTSVFLDNMGFLKSHCQLSVETWAPGSTSLSILTIITIVGDVISKWHLLAGMCQSMLRSKETHN